MREAIEIEAMKDDNRGKLERAVADERHLFVWIDPLKTPVAAAAGLMDIGLPTACRLPPEVDLWVAIPVQTDDSDDVREHIWRYDGARSWTRHRPRADPGVS